jgi:hypothetical protein
MYKGYSRDAIAKVELTEGSFYTIKVSQTVIFSIVYKTIWLATIYHFLQLTKIPYFKDKGESKPKAIINKCV